MASRVASRVASRASRASRVASVLAYLLLLLWLLLWFFLLLLCCLLVGFSFDCCFSVAFSFGFSFASLVVSLVASLVASLLHSLWLLCGPLLTFILHSLCLSFTFLLLISCCSAGFTVASPLLLLCFFFWLLFCILFWLLSMLSPHRTPTARVRKRRERQLARVIVERVPFQLGSASRVQHARLGPEDLWAAHN